MKYIWIACILRILLLDVHLLSCCYSLVDIQAQEWIAEEEKEATDAGSLQDMLNRLAITLEVVCVNTDNDHRDKVAFTVFDAANEPSINVRDYIYRLQRLSRCSEAMCLIAVIYLDRLIVTGKLPIRCISIHRLIGTSFLLANKFLEDSPHTNKTWASIIGVSKAELSRMERTFLITIDYNLFCKDTEYRAYRRALLDKNTTEKR